MWRTANALMSGLIVVLAGVVGVGLLGITAALEWGEWNEKTTLMLELLRWVFPYLFFICLAAVAMGILNARGHFFLPALGALILNVVMIGSVLWLAPRWGDALNDQIFALAIGVLVAGVAQLLYQLPTLWREGFRPQWISPWGDDSLRTILTRLGPGVIGVAAFQINRFDHLLHRIFCRRACGGVVWLRRAPVGIASGIICCLDGDVSTSDPRGVGG